MSTNSDIISDSFQGLFSAVGSGESTGANAPGDSGEASPQSQGNNNPGAGPGETALSYAELLPGIGTLIGIGADIASIFGGGTKAAPVFEKYELPSSQQFNAAISPTGALDAADSNMYGLARDTAPQVVASLAAGGDGSAAAPITAAPAAAPSGTLAAPQVAARPGPTAAPSSTAAAPSGTLAAAQVAARPGPTAAPSSTAAATTNNNGHTFNNTFQISALDGPGVAAMSDQIAASVRQSLLTSNSLADVITNDLN